jgi:hypothetical protein
MRYVIVKCNLPVKISSFFRSILSSYLDNIYYIDLNKDIPITEKYDNKIGDFYIYLDRETIYNKFSDKIKPFAYIKPIFVNVIKPQDILLTNDKSEILKPCLSFISQYYDFKSKKKDRKKYLIYGYFRSLRTNVLFLDNNEENKDFTSWKNVIDKVFIDNIFKMEDYTLYSFLNNYQIIFYFYDEDDNSLKIKDLLKRIDDIISFKIYFICNGNIDISFDFKNIIFKKVDMQRFISENHIDVLLNKNTYKLNFINVLECEECTL